MCGFAGVIAWDEKYRTSRQTLETMSRAIAHRGPDGEGYHLTREHEPIMPDAPQVSLAFRRLAILDPDPRSDQPFTIGPLTMVFNGEIYNFRALRAEISKLRPDYPWRTTGDTEVLLMSYALWREKCIEHLNGMFAIAIWDEQKKELFLARDRMGQKPLYVATPYCAPAIPAVAFASELSALRSLGWLNAEMKEDALCAYLRTGYIGDEATIYRGAAKVAPAMWRTFAYGRAGGDYYFSPEKQRPSAPHAADETRRLMLKAVERQMVSDVPLGIFLSGGIDSSVVAAAARRCGAVQTFSISFPDPRYDESIYAQQVASHLGTQHHEFRVSPQAVQDLPRLSEVFGEPFADSSAIPTYYLSSETRKHVKVALSGDGGDELFGGYDRYRAMKLSSRLAQLPQFARHIAATVARPWSGGHPKSKLTRAGRLLGALHLSDAARYASYMRLFDEPTIRALLVRNDHPRDDEIENAFQQYLDAGANPAEAGLAVDRVTYLPGDLLTKVDRCSMAFNLEVRSPFMDHELVQFAAGLTTDQLLKGGAKRMLREAFAKDLPDIVFKRKKMGFAIPIGEWFRGELRGMLRDHLFAAKSFARAHFNMKVVERLVDEHEAERVDHSQRLYALLMLELWWQQQQR
jgi:asparagine synthase (glutamine-hydrolysing)